MVPRGGRSRAETAPLVDLPGTRAAGVHRGLSHDYQRSARRGWPALRSLRAPAHRGGAPMSNLTLGQLVYAFLVDHLQVAKGLRPSSIASYRDGLRLFLRFVAADVGARITALPLSALTTERVLHFLRSLEDPLRRQSAQRECCDP